MESLTNMTLKQKMPTVAAVQMNGCKLKFKAPILIWCLAFVLTAGCDRTEQETSSTKQSKQQSDSSGLAQMTPQTDKVSANLQHRVPKTNAAVEFPYEGLYREFISIQNQFDYPEEQDFLPVEDGKSPPLVDVSALQQSIANRDTEIQLPKEFAEALRVGGLRRGGISPFVFCSAKQANDEYLTKLKTHDFFTKQRDPSPFTRSFPEIKMVKIDKGWRNGWIPLAVNEASLIFLDLDPDSDGQFAQVVLYEQSEFILTVLAPNLEEFFKSLPERIDQEETDWPYLKFY